MFVYLLARLGKVCPKTQGSHRKQGREIMVAFERDLEGGTERVQVCLLTKLRLVAFSSKI